MKTLEESHGNSQWRAFSTYVPVDMYQQLQAAARAEGRSVSNMLRKILAEYLGWSEICIQKSSGSYRKKFVAEEQPANQEVQS